MDPHTRRRPRIRFGLVCFLIMLPVAAYAETVVLDCVEAYDFNLCPSHWVIDSTAQTVTWRWCDSPDKTESRAVSMTADRIAFAEEFAATQYVFDRKSGLMTITIIEKLSGERILRGVAFCR